MNKIEHYCFENCLFRGDRWDGPFCSMYFRALACDILDDPYRCKECLEAELSKEFQPELGQMSWGNPHQRFDCPEYVEHLFYLIEEVLERKVGFDPLTGSPFRNTGNVSGFKNEVFEVHAYDWSKAYDCVDEKDPGQLFNFKYKDFEVSWYKYCGRGMSCNREMGFDEAMKMLEDCMKSLEREK